MFRFLRELFGGGRDVGATGAAGDPLLVEAYWCDSSIKLPRRVRTPLGSRVTVVNVCVDIEYSMRGGHVVLHRVRLSHAGGTIMGSEMTINVASKRTGEAWRTFGICSESHLRDAVERDLSSGESRLRRIMMGKWRDVNRDAFAQSVAEALNSRVPAEELARLIATAGRGNEISFTYTKPNGRSQRRQVSVWGVSGKCIRAEDHKDGKVKNFRIDRITNAARA